MKHLRDPPWCFSRRRLVVDGLMKMVPIKMPRFENINSDYTIEKVDYI
ncbi:Hypothetical protein OINT_2001769 [Brucella intermedia LMG 3301]|uniref:Uncharacterized protein n=1 Tax=Brucella intermedia LMG 3301 TaxID=641118 RepID=C4WQM8_9HYPH|nr:Hypothetical protein OINT_2001769 [Brucella intermedia LMG 3301]